VGDSALLHPFLVSRLKEMVIDLHVHTSRGGYDSNLSLPRLIEEAEGKGLDGVCVTEHNSVWARQELEAFSSDHSLVLVSGMEVETDVGHIVILGLDRYVSGIHRASGLRRLADEIGGFLIGVHPFRRFFDLEDIGLREKRSWSQAIENAMALPILSVVDEIEVLNGCCTEKENMLALEVAGRLGMRGTGGSDAHSEHGIGCCVTIFQGEVRCEVDLIAELKAGRFRSARRHPNGQITPY
jgi:hypothetical protein